MSCKSPLKYVGSKTKLLPSIYSYIPEDTEAIFENFCGSAALSFSKDIPFYLSDMSLELINFYLQLRENPEDLYKEAIRMSLKHSKAYFLKVRQWDRIDNFNDTTAFSETLRAARYLYIIYHGFNGLYRVNQRGQCNTPYGGVRTYPNDIEQLLENSSNHLNTYCKGIFHKQFDDHDLLRIILYNNKKTFVLADPPYEKGDNGKKVFQEYTITKIDEKFTNRLVSYLDHLDREGLHFLMTNTSCKMIEDTYRKWNIESIPVNYKVGTDISRKGNKFEMFVSNISTL